VEAINRYLSSLGTVGPAFDKAMLELHKSIRETDPTKFDRALSELGKLLGFGAYKPTEPASPDSVWNLGTAHVILFEAKSDESPHGGISVSTCRQAQGHQAWQNNRPFFTQEAQVTTVVVSPRTSISSDAVPHADRLYYVSTDEIRDMFSASEACLRRTRSACAGLQAEQVFNVIMENMTAAGLTPDDILSRIRRTPLLALPRS